MFTCDGGLAGRSTPARAFILSGIRLPIGCPYPIHRAPECVTLVIALPIPRTLATGCLFCLVNPDKHAGYVHTRDLAGVLGHAQDRPDEGGRNPRSCDPHRPQAITASSKSISTSRPGSSPRGDLWHIEQALPISALDECGRPPRPGARFACGGWPWRALSTVQMREAGWTLPRHPAGPAFISTQRGLIGASSGFRPR